MFYQWARDRGDLSNKGANTLEERDIDELGKLLKACGFDLYSIHSPYQVPSNPHGTLQRTPYEDWPQLICNNIIPEERKICLLNYPLNPKNQRSMNHWVAIYGYKKLESGAIMLEVGNPLGGKRELWPECKIADIVYESRRSGCGILQLAVLKLKD